MTNTSKTIVFFGTDHFSAAALRALIAAGYPIGAVVTKPDSRSGRGQTVTKPLVKTIAEEHGITVWQPTRLTDIAADITAFDTPIGVLSSYGRIVPQSIIDLFTPGIINIHPSLLPLYRGPSPIEAAILNGDTTTGVTVMQLTAAMDAGPLYAQETMPLNGTETQPELHETLSAKGSELLLSVLPNIIDGTLQPTPQDDTKATYCHLLKKEDGLLDPSTLTAREAEQRVRAFLLFPKTKLTLHGHTVSIKKAHSSTERAGLSVECHDGQFLVIDELIAPSGRTMTGTAFLNGYAAA